MEYALDMCYHFINFYIQRTRKGRVPGNAEVFRGQVKVGTKNTRYTIIFIYEYYFLKITDYSIF